MDSSRFSRFLESFKTFLLSRLSREALVFAFFVLLSAGFWLMQALNETNELEIDYDLVLDNVPEGTVITSELPSPIEVVVRDKGTSLIRYYAHFGSRSLTIDFSQYDNGGTYGRVILPHSALEKLLQPVLGASTRVVTIRRDTRE